MPHGAESQIKLRTMPHSAEFVWHSTESKKILSAFTVAVKVKVYQKINHKGSCLPHGRTLKF
jgi:hypothetical protein